MSPRVTVALIIAGVRHRSIHVHVHVVARSTSAGIRRAGPGDLDAVAGLLRPLEEAGTLVKRSREELANMLTVRGG
jgi:hypothetical protein